MRISDWSSDVCSSDLTRRLFDVEKQALELLTESRALRSEPLRVVADSAHHMLHILGRIRERYPSIAMVVSAGNSEDVIAQHYDYEAEVAIIGELPHSRDYEGLQRSTHILIAAHTPH